jgi:hypothetical protein
MEIGYEHHHLLRRVWINRASKVGGGASDILKFWVDFVCYCYSALAMCMIGCAGPLTPSKIQMYHTLVVAPAFLAIFTIGPSATILR